MATNLKFKQAKREEVLDLLSKILEQQDEEVMRVGTNEIAFPTVLDNGDEETILIKVSIPTGSRGRNSEVEPYDPCTAHQDYIEKMEQKKEKEERKKKEKEEKKKRDEKIREQKKLAREKKGA